jgi:hypothetical protein
MTILGITLSILLLGVIIVIAFLIGISLDDNDKLKIIPRLTAILIISIAFSIPCWKKTFRLNIKTKEKPQVETRITTKVKNGVYVSDTTYVYHFNN